MLVTAERQIGLREWAGRKYKINKAVLRHYVESKFLKTCLRDRSELSSHG